MNKLIIALVILLLPMMSYAGGPPKEKHWICYQLGTVGKKDIVVISTMHSDTHPRNMHNRKWQFYKAIKAEHKRFKGHFEPECREFRNEKKAAAFVNKNKSRSKHGGYELNNIKFHYDPKLDQNEEQMESEAPLY